MFIGMGSTTIWAIFLPPVKHSLYFPNKKKIEETSMGQSTVTIYNPKKDKDVQLSIEAAPKEEVCDVMYYRVICENIVMLYFIRFCRS